MNRILILIISFLFTYNISSQESNDITEPKSSLLWEISREDIPFKSYMFGTNHLFSSSLVDTSSVIMGVLEKISVLIPEVDLNTVDTAGMKELLFLSNGEYYKFSSKEEENRLKKYIKNETGLSVEYLLKFKPIVVYLTLVFLDNQKMKGKDTKVKSEVLDKYFLRLSVSLNKEIIPLEEPIDQVKLLTDKIPFDQQLSMLIGYSSRDSLVKRRLFEIDSCYSSYDLDCLLKEDHSDSISVKFKHYIFDERNLTWIKKLPEIINYKSSLIAVGAGHLPGKNGLINLLTELGYVVKPVKFW